MPPRRRGKKAAKLEDPVTDAKLEELRECLDFYKSAAQEYETQLNVWCNETCLQIEKMYMDKLRSIPPHLRSMTVSQIMELQEKENVTQTDSPNKADLVKRTAHDFQKYKIASEKKRTFKKDRKRSVSATASTKPLTCANPGSNVLSRMSRTISDSNLLLTPSSKLNKVPSMAVTPKFNPKIPISNLARIPKAGEIVMSLSGSPLQNFANDTKMHLSLGQGKVLTFTADGALETGLDNEIDDMIKEKLKNVKKKLDEILQA